jgi:hypothetical protein
VPASPLSDTQEDLHPAKRISMTSDVSDEDIFDYDDEEASDMEYDDGDSSINDGSPTLPFFCSTR